MIGRWECGCYQILWISNGVLCHCTARRVIFTKIEGLIEEHKIFLIADCNKKDILQVLKQHGVQLLKSVVASKAAINAKNNNDQCFKWDMTRAFNPVNTHPDRVTTHTIQFCQWWWLNFRMTIPSYLLMITGIILAWLPILTAIVSTSHRACGLPASQKHAVIAPLLKKSSLDPSQLKNYRPVSNLTFLSKVV